MFPTELAMFIQNLRMSRAVAISLLSVALSSGVLAQSRVINQTREQQTQTGESTQQRVARIHSQLDTNDLLVAQIWGMSNEEMVRAKVLLKGPRASFSVENLSPVEALGIHARDEKERVKYAEMFARALQADVERSLAWSRTFQEVQARLFPNQVVVDYSGQAPVAVPTATADMLGVPRTLVQDPAPSARRSANAKKR
jgi:hypothetical protein